jgi:hypothetical protein
MNERHMQLVHYATVRRLQVLEKHAGIEIDPKDDILELPVVRIFKPDAISQADLEELERRKELAWEAEKKAWLKTAVEELKASQAQQDEKLKAEVAIAVLQAQQANDAKKAGEASAPAMTPDEVRQMMREEIRAALAGGGDAKPPKK